MTTTPTTPFTPTMTTRPTLVECWDRPKEALAVYRQRFYELQEEGRAKPDMIAYKELRGEWTPARKHGELPGVPIGLHLCGRGEAAILGIHQKILSGIDAMDGKPCYAVCISGGYADDDDNSDEIGTIYYTGEGGQGKNRQQVEDQSYKKPGNAALLLSYKEGTTIRVIRGQSPDYYYLGLYRCTDYTYEAGIHGKKVFKFKLVPVIENQSPAARAMPIETKFHSPVTPVPAAPLLVVEAPASAPVSASPCPFKMIPRKSLPPVVGSSNSSLLARMKAPPLLPAKGKQTLQKYKSPKKTSKGRLNDILKRKR